MFLLIIAAILYPLAFLDKAIDNNNKKLLMLLICIFFIFLGGVRWNTGTDWNAYYYFFLEANTYSNAINSYDNFEWGYAVLNFLINDWTGSYTVFLLSFSIITIYTKFLVLSDKLFLNYGLYSLFLYYCYYVGDIVSNRQLLATSLVFLSLIFVIKKKKINFILMIFIASLIHRTAIICFILYPLFYMRIEKKYLYFIYFFGMACGMMLHNFDISDFHIPFLSNFSWFSTYQKKLDAYSELGMVTYGDIDSNASIILGYIRKFLYIIPLIFLYKKDQIKGGVLNICVVGSALYFIVGGLASDFRRFGVYFDIFEILLIPAIVYSVKSRNIRYALLFYFSILSLIKLFGYIFSFWELFDPFYTIFDIYNFRNMW